MKTSNQLLYATGASAAILGLAIYLQEDLPVAQAPVALPELVPCSAASSMDANQAGTRPGPRPGAGQ